MEAMSIDLHKKTANSQQYAVDSRQLNSKTFTLSNALKILVFFWITSMPITNAFTSIQTLDDKAKKNKISKEIKRNSGKS